MQLYEARNGMTGCSYVRCYIWANTLPGAKIMARGAFVEYFARRPLPFAYDESRLVVKLLMTSDARPFCTKVSSEGWET